MNLDAFSVDIDHPWTAQHIERLRAEVGKAKARVLKKIRWGGTALLIGVSGMGFIYALNLQAGNKGPIVYWFFALLALATVGGLYFQSADFDGPLLRQMEEWLKPESPALLGLRTQSLSESPKALAYLQAVTNQQRDLLSVEFSAIANRLSLDTAEAERQAASKTLLELGLHFSR
jgi:hypothetical protein